MTIVYEAADVARPAELPVPQARRRRAVAVLATLVAAAAVAAIGTGAVAAWAALGASVALCAGYAMAWKRASRREFERQLQAVLGEAGDFFAGGTELADLAIRPEQPAELPPAPPGIPAWRQGAGVARFVVSYAAGWALAPVVFALTVAVGRTPRDTTGQRWLANLRATQTRLKDGSMRTLAITATATASVTAAGGVTLLAGGGVAVAAPVPAAVAVGVPHAAGVGLPAAATTTYTVVEGDTLSSVAARFGTTWEALAAANGIADPNLIYPGQVLTIGGSSAGSSSAGSGSGGSTYTVQRGDTLSSVAARFGTTWEQLAEINGLANPNFITVGEVLKLSGTATVTTAATTSSGSGGTTASESSAAQIAVRTALAQVGKPYVWGGAGPNSFDCSGLVMYAWEAAGVQLAHYTVSQYEETTRITESELEPGDLVFYDTGDGAQPGHVTMYIGNGQIVTADEPGTDIRVEVLDWDGTPMGFGRVKI